MRKLHMVEIDDYDEEDFEGLSRDFIQELIDDADSSEGWELIFEFLYCKYFDSRKKLIDFIKSGKRLIDIVDDF